MANVAVPDHPPSASELATKDLPGVVGAHPRTARDVLAAIIHNEDPDEGIETRLPSGFTPLDEALNGGFAPQDLVVLGGKPGVGKTVAMVQWARNLAAAGHRVLFASYELGERNLLSRLLTAEVGSRNHHLDHTSRRNVAQIIRDSVKSGSVSNDTQVREVIRQAYDAIDAYADRLLFQRVSGQNTGRAELAQLGQEWVGDGGIMIVDYLQKVPVRGVGSDEERVLKVSEALKEQAMSQNICIIAAAAVDGAGLGERRVRLQDLRGSALIAHEADVAIAMNEKHTALSKNHLAFDAHLLEEARNQVLFSIEKNREGATNVHVEFDKQFEDYRFDPFGRYCAQKLADGLFEE